MPLSFFEQQLRAVRAPVGPVLVVAGPGAGKTRCLTGRIEYLIAEHRAAPSRICAITFTNKAAQEVARRLHEGLGDVAEQLTLGTIHSLCLQVLRRFGRRAGLPTGFGVADEKHQKLVLSRLGVHTNRHSSLLTLFGRRRLQGYSLRPGDETTFRQYQTELRSNHLIDYDEILALARLLLESGADILPFFQDRWDHLLVDEFQDLDATQYAVLKLIAEKHRSLFAVGDDDQSIFSWRGADPVVMRRFQGDFGIDEPIVLDVNCRCSRVIFAAAQRVLPRERLLFDKRITAVRESPYPVRAVGHDDEEAETGWLVEDLTQDLARSGLRPGDYAVLYRTHAAGQRLEQALVKAGVACQMGKGQALADDAVLGQVLDALRVVLRPDADLEVERLAARVLSEPLLAEVRRVPGPSLLARLRSYAEEKRSGDAAHCWRFLDHVENLRGLARQPGDLPGLIDAVLAQGVGPYENPLEGRHEKLHDPAEAPARALGERLAAAAAAGARLLLTPAGGLEIPVKLMLRRALPGVAVQYLAPDVEPGAGDVVLSLVPGASARGAEVLRPGEPGRLVTTQIFKALQHVESRGFRPAFTDYVAFDTETTGLNLDTCEVLELAGVRVNGGRVADTFHSLVRCERPVSPGATEVHGYTAADLAGQPTMAEVWPRFRAFAGDRVLVGHNAHRFDVPVLRRVTAAFGGLDGLVCLDTLALARSLFPSGRRLQDLADRFGIDAGRGHHALDDSLCLARVFERLQEERLRRSRKACLADLLGCVALGAALENRPAEHDEDRVLVEAGAWRSPGQYADIVNAYVEEGQALGNCPPLEELLDRMGGGRAWPGFRREPAPRDRHPEARERLRGLLDALTAKTRVGRLREFLDLVALTRSDGAGAEAGRVTLLTFHATKGLEFARVYLVGVEDAGMPGTRALEENRRDDVMESRRLLYVAMTRAKEKLTLTYCRQRDGRPGGGTLFLDEMGLTRPASARTPEPV